MDKKKSTLLKIRKNVKYLLYNFVTTGGKKYLQKPFIFKIFEESLFELFAKSKESIKICAEGLEEVKQ